MPDRQPPERRPGLRVLLVDTTDSPYLAFLEAADGVDDIIVAGSAKELANQLERKDAAPDVVLVSLILELATPLRHQRKTYVELEGLELIREGVARLAVPFVAIAHWPHMETILRARRAGAAWCVTRRTEVPADLVDSLERLRAGERLVPDGADARTANLWLATNDALLGGCSERDIEIVEHLLLEADRTTLVGRLELANRATVRARLARVLERAGVDSEEALVAHARALGITPADITLQGTTPAANGDDDLPDAPAIRA